jgi:hypothetical protein
MLTRSAPPQPAFFIRKALPPENGVGKRIGLTSAAGKPSMLFTRLFFAGLKLGHRSRLAFFRQTTSLKAVYGLACKARAVRRATLSIDATTLFSAI